MTRRGRHWVLAGVILLGVAVVWVARPYFLHAPIPRADLAGVEPGVGAAVAARVAEVEKDPTSAEAWGRLGVVYDIHAFHSEAILCYREARARDPKDYRWAYFMGICTTIGDQEGALAHFQEAARLNPGYAPIHISVGRGHLLAERLDEAEQAFRSALACDETVVRAHIGLAKVSLARDDALQALTHLGDAERHGGGQAELHGLAAETARRLGRQDEAERHTALAIGKENFEMLADPVRTALGLRDGMSLRWRRARSEDYLAKGQTDLAVREWQDALASTRELAEVHVELGEVYLRSNRTDEAIAELEEALSLRPRYARAHEALGDALVRVGEPARAIEAFEAALAIDPRLHLARGNLGILLIDTGKVDEGLEELRRSAEALPGNWETQLNLATALLSQRRDGEALDVLSRAAALGARHARLQFEYGRLLAVRGRFAEAAAAFQVTVDVDPSRPVGHVNLARALRKAARHRDAVGAYRAGLERHPDDVDLLTGLAWVLATAPDAAVRNGEEAVALMLRIEGTGRPLDPTLLEVSAAAHAEAGNLDEALALAGRAMDQASAEHERRLQQQVELYRQGKPIRDLPD